MLYVPVVGFVCPRWHRDDEGASLVEYALLVALIAIVCIAAVTFFGNKTSTSFSHSASSIGNA